MRYFSYNMMYYRISKNEKILFFGKKNRPGVGSDLNCFADIQYEEFVCCPKHSFSGECYIDYP